MDAYLQDFYIEDLSRTRTVDQSLPSSNEEGIADKSESRRPTKSRNPNESAEDERPLVPASCRSSGLDGQRVSAFLYGCVGQCRVVRGAQAIDLLSAELTKRPANVG